MFPGTIIKGKLHETSMDVEAGDMLYGGPDGCLIKVLPVAVAVEGGLPDDDIIIYTTANGPRRVHLSRWKVLWARLITALRRLRGGK